MAKKKPTAPKPAAKARKSTPRADSAKGESYSAKDIEKMTTDDGRVTADCQFCGAHYDMDPASVGFEAETDGA